MKAAWRNDRLLPLALPFSKKVHLSIESQGKPGMIGISADCAPWSWNIFLGTNLMERQTSNIVLAYHCRLKTIGSTTDPIAIHPTKPWKSMHSSQCNTQSRAARPESAKFEFGVIRKLPHLLIFFDPIHEHSCTEHCTLVWLGRFRNVNYMFLYLSLRSARMILLLDCFTRSTSLSETNPQRINDFDKHIEFYKLYC